MTLTLAQFDFPSAGPWGPEMAQAYRDLAQDIAAEPGLVWKIWTEDAAGGRAGGIYLFESRAAATAFRDKHMARLTGFGITGIAAHVFDINGELSAITRAPL